MGEASNQKCTRGEVDRSVSRGNTITNKQFSKCNLKSKSLGRVATKTLCQVVIFLQQYHDLNTIVTSDDQWQHPERSVLFLTPM